MQLINKLHKIATIIDKNYTSNGVRMEIEVSSEDRYLVKGYILSED